ncbi:hypothetical protein EV714DRAFT_267432 [Schizophyllum commune]
MPAARTTTRIRATRNRNRSLKSKAYSCPRPDCRSAFMRKADRDRHMRQVHGGIKKWTCDWPGCTMKFAHDGAYKNHMNTHTGAQPHACRICDVRFGDPSSRSRHMREKHLQPGAYTCCISGCTKQLKRRSTFVDHFKKYHNIEEPEEKFDIDSMAPPMRTMEEAYMLHNGVPMPSTSSGPEEDDEVVAVPCAPAGYDCGYYDQPDPYVAYVEPYQPIPPYDYGFYYDAPYLPPQQPYGYEMSPAGSWDQYASSSSSSSPASSRESSSDPSLSDQSPGPFANIKLRQESPDFFCPPAPLDASEPFVDFTTIKREDNTADLLVSDGYDGYDGYGYSSPVADWDLQLTPTA